MQIRSDFRCKRRNVCADTDFPGKPPELDDAIDDARNAERRTRYLNEEEERGRERGREEERERGLLLNLRAQSSGVGFVALGWVLMQAGRQAHAHALASSMLPLASCLCSSSLGVSASACGGKSPLRFELYSQCPAPAVPVVPVVPAVPAVPHQC